MSKIVKPITLKVTSAAGQKRLSDDMLRKEQFKQAIKAKKPTSQIEKEFGVKFITPL